MRTRPRQRTYTSGNWSTIKKRQHNPATDAPLTIRSRLTQLRLMGLTDRRISEIEGISIEQIQQLVATNPAGHNRHTTRPSERFLQVTSEDETRAAREYGAALTYADLPDRQWAVDW